jgi:hypothetical protein
MKFLLKDLDLYRLGIHLRRHRRHGYYRRHRRQL